MLYHHYSLRHHILHSKPWSVSLQTLYRVLYSNFMGFPWRHWCRFRAGSFKNDKSSAPHLLCTNCIACQRENKSYLLNNTQRRQFLKNPPNMSGQTIWWTLKRTPSDIWQIKKINDQLFLFCPSAWFRKQNRDCICFALGGGAWCRTAWSLFHCQPANKTARKTEDDSKNKEVVPGGSERRCIPPPPLPPSLICSPLHT